MNKGLHHVTDLTLRPGAVRSTVWVGGNMVPSPTLVRRLRPGGSSRLLAVILILTPALLPSTLKAQTTNPQEISSRDVEPTFKLQSERNVVRVRVVVRNAKGEAVDNLRQEDFRVFDRGKPQSILSFSLEKPALKATAPLPPKPAEKANAEAENADETATPATAPRRFLAIYFDDVNTPFVDMARARDAADHVLPATIQPEDRVALFTSSGQDQVDFTSNLAQVHQGLFKLQHRPIVEEDKSCGTIPPYEARLILDFHDPEALELAIEEFINCYGPDPMVKTHVEMSARRSLSFSDAQSTAALRGIESVVRRLASLPGERSMIIVSAGFLTEDLHFQLDEIIDRALRAGVVINTVDARGLYGDPTSDASVSDFAYTTNPVLRNRKRDILLNSQRAQADAMFALSHDTGGVLFENDNGLEAGFRKTAGLADAYYLLTFSPQNLKHDGTFHPIKVTLAAAKGFSMQARHGYYAPRKSEDPATQEKEEIREAVFSREETQDLPIDVHTQFFMKTESDACITVQTSVDLHPLRFRKEEDRNVDKLLFVTVLFDQDGHEIGAQEKSVDLQLRDGSLERYLQSGITMENLFDVKPGTYLVRTVVRDSASGEISGLNRTVEIPYQ